MQQFEKTLHNDLHQYLSSLDKVDERLPECPDLEEQREPLAKSENPKVIREIQK